MSGEIKIFKRELVGGFDRQDVIEYIERQAKEKQRLKEDAAAAGREIGALQQQITALDAEVKNVKTQAMNETEAALAELMESYLAVKSDIEAITGSIKNELSLIGDALARLSGILENAGTKLKAAVKQETE